MGIVKMHVRGTHVRSLYVSKEMGGLCTEAVKDVTSWIHT